jgi:hypothetical protein
VRDAKVIAKENAWDLNRVSHPCRLNSPPLSSSDCRALRFLSLPLEILSRGFGATNHSPPK